MSRIIEESPSLIKKTSKFNSEVQTIKETLNMEYRDLINREKSILKKLYLKLKCRIEIYKHVKKLTSQRNLYLER